MCDRCHKLEQEIAYWQTKLGFRIKELEQEIEQVTAQMGECQHDREHLKQELARSIKEKEQNLYLEQERIAVIKENFRKEKRAIFDDLWNISENDSIVDRNDIKYLREKYFGDKKEGDS